MMPGCCHPTRRRRYGTGLTCIRGVGLGLGLFAAALGLGAGERLSNQVAEHVAALKQRTDIPSGYAPIEPAWIARLPTPEIRTPADLAAVGDVEHNAVALEGYITRVIPVPARLAARAATTWEFYLHLRAGPPQDCEYQDDPRNVVAVITPPFQPPQTGWDFDVLGDLCRMRTRVRVSGWLLYDYFSRLQVGRSRVSPWGIHPVTQIEVWNAQDRSWDHLR